MVLTYRTLTSQLMFSNVSSRNVGNKAVVILRNSQSAWLGYVMQFSN